MRPDFVVDLLPSGALSVRFPYDPQAVELVRAVIGRRWHKEEKFWSIPPSGLRTLQEQAARRGISLALSAKVKQALNLGQDRRDALDAAKMNQEHLDLPTNTTPYPFQFSGIRFLEYALRNFRGAFLGDDMGLGKTFQASSLVALKPKLTNVLVLCPATLKYTWADDLDKHYPQLTYTVIGAPRPGKKSKANAAQRAEDWNADTLIKISNYELLLRDVAARVISWDLVIADEAPAYLKNYKAQRTKAAKKLRRQYSLALGGIPIENRLEELHSVMDFVVPGLLGSGWVFVQQHCVYDHWGRLVGYRGIDQVKERIAPYYLRRTKAEVLSELPAKVYNDVLIEMSGDEWALYDDIKRQIREKIEDNPKLNAGNILTEMLRLKQATCDARLLDVPNVRSSKVAALLELCEQAIESEHKVVVFTQFAQYAMLLRQELEQLYDIDLPFIAGSVSAEERGRAVRSFQAGERPAFISTDAGAYGITLTAADIVVHMDMTWNPAKMRQREDRLHRIGQLGSVQVVNMMCKRTIDDYVRKILHKKLALIRDVMDEEIPEEDAIKVSREDLMDILT